MALGRHIGRTDEQTKGETIGRKYYLIWLLDSYLDGRTLTGEARTYNCRHVCRNEGRLNGRCKGKTNGLRDDRTEGR
jgi:hypothetical protein